MRRDQLEHLLRAAAEISGEEDIIVLGSQSILGSFTEDTLPAEASFSAEADFAFFDDADEEKADDVEGSLGEMSMFHDSFSIYAEGVSITTAVLPEGWRDRIVVLDTPQTGSGRGLCLEPHDLVISKLVANRPKDREFAAALLREGLVDKALLIKRAQQLVDRDRDTRRIVAWLELH